VSPNGWDCYSCQHTGDGDPRPVTGASTTTRCGTSHAMHVDNTQLACTKSTRRRGAREPQGGTWA
jgi:hypothetical protein